MSFSVGLSGSHWEIVCGSHGALSAHQLLAVLRRSYVAQASIPTPYVAEAGLELLNFLPPQC